MKSFYIVVFFLDIALALFIYLRLFKNNLIVPAKYLIPLLFILALTPILFNLTMRFPIPNVVAFSINLLYGIYIILILGALVSLIPAIPLSIYQKWYPLAQQTKLIIQLSYLAFLVIFGGLSFYFALIHPPEVVKVKVAVDKNRFPNFPPLRVVQISDVHITPYMGKKNTQMIVDSVNKLNPDLIFITGDLIDAPPLKITDDLLPLKDLKANKGIFYVLGNHEYYRNIIESVNAIKKFKNITPLFNDSYLLKDEGIIILGLNDRTGSKDLYGPDPAKLLKMINDPQNEKYFKMLLLHQPKQFHDFKNLVDMAFAGHTHGGQIYPFNFVAKKYNDNFLEGLYKFQKEDRETYFYVNRGTGFWGPPLRFPDPREITLFEIH